ncbi:TPA: hypothetical protein ACH3X2_000585 [Trebouxia sp. C0005]
MSNQMWTHTQRQNTISQLAQKMSHLTAKPLAELHQLATDLENLAFSKAQGNQEQYVNILSKRMKKLEAQQSGLVTQQPSSIPQVLQPQDLAQQQHLRLQQQQQQAQQQQLLHQRQQQQMLLQRSQIQHQRAQSVQQAMASSAGSHDDDQFAQMSDVFGLYNSAPSASVSSQQPVNQAYMHAQSQAQAQKLQQQHKQQAAQMPQIPGQLPDQLKQQQQQAQQLQQRQYQQHLVQQQMRQQQQQLRLQQQQLQQRQQQHAQQPVSAGYSQQSQQQAAWQQPPLSVSLQQTGSGVSLADSENEARMNKFWSIQETIRNGYLYQLQALHSDPYLRPPFLAEKCKDYVVRALRVSLLRRGDPSPWPMWAQKCCQKS